MLFVEVKVFIGILLSVTFADLPTASGPQKATPPGLRQGQQKPPDDVLLEQDGCNPHQSPASFPLSFAGLTSATR